MSEEDKEEWFNKTDKNEDGVIDLAEFTEWHAKGDLKRELESHFDDYDDDGNGKITMKEFREWSPRKESFKKSDKNGDGVLDFTEMTELWKEDEKRKIKREFN